MNNKELAIDVFKHPLIQEILKQKLAESSVVNRLIVEEVLSELDEPKNTLDQNEFNQLLDLLKSGIAFEKIISNYGGQLSDEQIEVLKKVAQGSSGAETSDEPSDETEQQPQDTNTNLEVISDYLGWAAAASSLGGPATSPLTSALSVGSDSTAILDIYNLASEGKTEDALVKLTALVGGKAAASMVPGGEAFKKAGGKAAEQISKRFGKKVSEEVVAKALRGIAKGAAKITGEVAAKQIAKRAVAKQEEASQELEKAGITDKIKNYFGGLADKVSDYFSVDEAEKGSQEVLANNKYKPLFDLAEEDITKRALAYFIYFIEQPFGDGRLDEYRLKGTNIPEEQYKAGRKWVRSKLGTKGIEALIRFVSDKQAQALFQQIFTKQELALIKPALDPSAVDDQGQTDQKDTGNDEDAFELLNSTSRRSEFFNAYLKLVSQFSQDPNESEEQKNKLTQSLKQFDILEPIYKNNSYKEKESEAKQALQQISFSVFGIDREKGKVLRNKLFAFIKAGAKGTSDSELEVDEEQQEQEVEQAENTASAEEDFSDGSPNVTAEAYEEAIYNEMDRFYGQGDKPSFMKQIFLSAQGDLLRGLIGNLNKIISGQIEGGDPEEQAAFTDATRARSARSKEEPKSEPEKREDLEEGVRDVIKKGKDAFKKGYTDKLGDIETNINKMKRKAQGEDAVVEEFEFSRNEKVTLKRELSALADLLTRTKRIANDYKKYATRSSATKRFDGTTLEKSMNTILGHVQVHIARLVHEMIKIHQAHVAEAEEGVELQEVVDGDVERKEKIRNVSEFFNKTGNLYLKSLKPSMEAGEEEKAKKVAEEMRDYAKEIVPYFPKSRITSEGEIISLDDAIENLEVKIKQFSKVLRDIFMTVKDQAVSPEQISDATIALDSLANSIANDFNVPSKISRKDKEALKDINPEQETLSDQEAEEEVMPATVSWEDDKIKDWYEDILNDEQRMAIEEFIEQYNSNVMQEGLAAVFKHEAIDLATAKEALKVMSPLYVQTFKNLAINYSEELKNYLADKLNKSTIDDASSEVQVFEQTLEKLTDKFTALVHKFFGKDTKNLQSVIKAIMSLFSDRELNEKAITDVVPKNQLAKFLTELGVDPKLLIAKLDPQGFRLAEQIFTKKPIRDWLIKNFSIYTGLYKTVKEGAMSAEEAKKVSDELTSRVANLQLANKNTKSDVEDVNTTTADLLNKGSDIWGVDSKARQFLQAMFLGKEQRNESLSLGDLEERLIETLTPIITQILKEQ